MACFLCLNSRLAGGKSLFYGLREIRHHIRGTGKKSIAWSKSFVTEVIWNHSFRLIWVLRDMFSKVLRCHRQFLTPSNTARVFESAKGDARLRIR